MLHPRLRVLFSSFDQLNVGWCLLRVPQNLAAPTGDIDLLIDRADVDRVRHVLDEQGFIMLPGWTTAPNILALAYDAPTDQWLHLDIVTELAFGPHSALQTSAEAGCLAHRQRSDSIVTLTPDDAFWALLLHCLLDKHQFAPHYQRQLHQLAGNANIDGPLAKIVASVCPADWSPERMLQAVQHGEWGSLQDLGSPLHTNWRRHHPSRWLRSKLRYAWHVLQRVPTYPQRRGLSIALLGINGAGKSTLAQGLRRSFGLPTRTMYMGLWQSGGNDGATGEVNWIEVLCRPFRVWSRYLTAQYHQALGRLVIFDRYTYDAWQPPRPPLLWLKRPYFWLLAHLCPPPDLVLLLDVAGDLSFARKGEYSPEELEADRHAFLLLRQRITKIYVVDATRSKDAVRIEALNYIWQHYVARWGHAVRHSEEYAAHS